MKFLLSLFNHLESRIFFSHRERDLNKVTYDVLKIYELKLLHKRSIQASQESVVNTSFILIVSDLSKKQDTSSSNQLRIEEITEDETKWRRIKLFKRMRMSSTQLKSLKRWNISYMFS